MYWEPTNRQETSSVNYRISVTVITSLGLRLLSALPRPAASREADHRRADARIHRAAAFRDGGRDTRLEHQQRADNAAPRSVRAEG